ncbi:MAG: hypothetical protein K2N84_01510 [Clostridia bacterium]|nr:hypothetical protein [Clostridia bacterium]
MHTEEKIGSTKKEANFLLIINIFVTVLIVALTVIISLIEARIQGVDWRLPEYILGKIAISSFSGISTFSLSIGIEDTFSQLFRGRGQILKTKLLAVLTILLLVGIIIVLLSLLVPTTALSIIMLCYSVVTMGMAVIIRCTKYDNDDNGKISA